MAEFVKNHKKIFIALAVVVCTAACIGLIYMNYQSNKRAIADNIGLTTNEFTQDVKNGMITEVNYDSTSGRITGEFYESDEAKAAGDTKNYYSNYASPESLQALMDDYPDIEYTASGNVTATLSSTYGSGAAGLVITAILVGGVLLFGLGMFRRSRGMGAGEVMQTNGRKGREREVLEAEERPTVTFDDVAGIDEVVGEVREIEEFLEHPEEFAAMGARPPRGVLLAGDPGVGKTLIAKAIAGEAKVPFYSISGSDFVEMFVGVGARRMRDLFDKARKNAPSIIFIDEIDAIGKSRAASGMVGNDEREGTLNQFLVEMDGFEDKDNVILIAATNRPDMLDPALLRPGRFDRKIMVGRPDIVGREQILGVHARNKPLASDVTLRDIASLTAGFSGADLANLMNEAAILAVRRRRRDISMSEIQEAFERSVAGPEKKQHVMTDAEKRTLAYHESGHALVGHLLENSDPIRKITILPRGQALGYTLSIPDEDTFLQTRDQMIDSLAMLLGGRVAEEIANDGNITTGASNDLQRATATARDMVMKFGMSEKLGAFVYGASGPLMSKDYSPETASVIDEEARRLVQNAHDTAYRLLTGQRKLLDQMAEVLIERETIDGPAVEALLAGNWEQYLKEEHDDEVTRKREEDKRRQRLAAAKQKRDSEGGEDDQSRDIVDDLVKDGSAKPAF